MKLLYVNKRLFFTYLIITGELQKFTNIIVLYSILAKVEFVHRNDVFGIIVFYVFVYTEFAFDSFW